MRVINNRGQAPESVANKAEFMVITSGPASINRPADTDPFRPVCTLLFSSVTLTSNCLYYVTLLFAVKCDGPQHASQERSKGIETEI